ncbi:hypothetical protein JCM11251_000671 [Rhodosporidiobolus azoricus]
MARGKTGLSIIPQVYGTRTSSTLGTFIYFEHLPGTPLSRTPVNSTQCRELISSLHAIVSALQDVRAPDSAHVGGFGGRNLHAISLGWDSINFPPLLTPSSLEAWLATRYLTSSTASPDRWEEVVVPCFDSTAPLVLTHGDFATRNILVDGSRVRVTGLIDWELAGWYPPWVEKYRAVYEAYIGGWDGRDGVVGTAVVGEKDEQSRYNGLLALQDAFVE